MSHLPRPRHAAPSHPVSHLRADLSHGVHGVVALQEATDHQHTQEDVPALQVGGMESISRVLGVVYGHGTSFLTMSEKLALRVTGKECKEIYRHHPDEMPTGFVSGEKWARFYLCAAPASSSMLMTTACVPYCGMVARQSNHCLIEINLGTCGLYPQRIHGVCALLSKTVNLKHLILDNNPLLRDEGLRVVLTSVASDRLTFLSLRSCGIEKLWPQAVAWASSR